MSCVDYISHQPDYENYYYFAINLITHTVPEPPPATYLQNLSRRIPELEYIGPVGHLDDAVQVRVKKTEEVDVYGLIECSQQKSEEEYCNRRNRQKLYKKNVEIGIK